MFIDHIADDINSRNLEPRACAKKYFSIASISWNLFDEFIIGMNDSILISRAAHVISQLLLEIAISDLEIRMMNRSVEN